MDIVGFAVAANGSETEEAGEGSYVLPAAAGVSTETTGGGGGGETAAPPGWPAEVDLILSAMDAAHTTSASGGGDELLIEDSPLNRRAVGRRPYRVRAVLRLFSDRPGNGPWTLFTRDVGPRSLGFITPHRLPLGYGGWVELPSARPGGAPIQIHCTLYRCRQAVQGWFEGALSFNREQHLFE